MLCNDVNGLKLEVSQWWTLISLIGLDYLLELFLIEPQNRTALLYTSYICSKVILAPQNEQLELHFLLVRRINLKVLLGLWGRCLPKSKIRGQGYFNE